MTWVVSKLASLSSFHISAHLFEVRATYMLTIVKFSLSESLRVMNWRHKKRPRVVVGVFLPEKQCVKKEDFLSLAVSSSPSLSCSSICDGREQSSYSSQGSEFGGDLPVNEVTWPELAHQYLVTLIQVLKSGYPSGLRAEERKRFIRCLQRDGGVLFGAAATVVAVESDAQVMMWFWCGLYVGCSTFTIIG
ncbi:unnamed protein product [Sphagnum troendelagicum]|uniref:Uncharacterized protein n=1 Tax=Sphagnum troendelagicum TaxID=128251 RepID=A0ABP0T7W8_9BRYO